MILGNKVNKQTNIKHYFYSFVLKMCFVAKAEKKCTLSQLIFQYNVPTQDVNISAISCRQQQLSSV